MAWHLGNKLENPHRPSAYYSNGPGAGGGRKPLGSVPEFIDVGIDFSMLVYPVAINELEEFEDTNDIGVYVFAWNVRTDGRGYATQSRRPPEMHSRDVSLLLFKGHYLWIKSFNAFISLRSFG